MTIRPGLAAFWGWALACSFGALGTKAGSQAAEPIDFVRDVRPIFQQHCYDCHSGSERKSGLRLDVRALAFKGGDRYGPDIIPGNESESPLIRLVMSDDADMRMPPDEKLGMNEIAILRRWIREGAVWPKDVDLVELKDIRDHWSFKPLQDATTHGSIDAFIKAGLDAKGIQRSPEIDRVQWLRRVTFDLIGLPPTPEDVDRFVNDTRDDAHRRVVDQLLQSDRYGERWAQHWLDVVRYADTHGFEVNTERPNAWPYRDYVIRSFNRDTPYDRFIKEQIAGDALGEDAATGFLVTASVLLPGQIGKDAPSMRLARQDALDEIVNNLGQTFLGLSIGCARCHDHKFDPITARDYYAMQAFVAGVEYDDRELRSEAAEARKREAEPLRQRVARIQSRLAEFSPLARPGAKQRVTDASRNVEDFSPRDARFVRFTIHDSNLHPQLGLIEPCIDEFEIFTDESEPRNVALASHGTKVAASGSKQSAAHRLEFVHDGQPGNSRSWMSATKGHGWILFELPEATRISRVVWSRDRTGAFTDRLPIAYSLEVGLSVDSLTKVAEAIPLRPTVGAGPQNTDRFSPVLTKKLRFNVMATSGLEPCIDELEVFNQAGENVALVGPGNRITTSGDRIIPGRHEAAFINDGLYGNEHSWMGNQPGKGWVEIEFATVQSIVRVVWSRDRTGKLLDRLPNEYEIQVHTEDGWRTVADSSDRRPYVAGMPRGPEFTLVGLEPDDSVQVERLLEERSELEKQIRVAEAGQFAFAGKFRKPDEIRLLSRGDPEQPKEVVAPATIEALKTLRLSEDCSEQERRRTLADWIASSSNPLTARVMVNRIWQGHFGRGLVETPSDFGNNGMKPSHPELLDWLAAEFIRSGWSVKHMHRIIVLSETYRQQGINYERTPQSSAAIGLDAEVRWLWRFPSRRLEAECIRDSMLAVSGLLDTSMYGRGFDLFDKRGGLSGFNPVETLTAENRRRMIYSHKVRRESEAVFGAFDCPDAGQSAAVRRQSTTPIQALNLMNSRFTLDVSKAFAERVIQEAGPFIDDQIRHAYLLGLSRKATAAEVDVARPVVQQHGLATLCRALLNSNEFLFIP